MLGVTDGIRDCVWLAVPQPTEWQHIGNQLNAAMVFARADLVNCVVSWSSERSVGQRRCCFKLGLDVELRNVAVAIQCERSPIGLAQKLSLQQLIGWVKQKVAQGHAVYTVYECCGFGYTLHEQLVEAGATSFITTPMRLSLERRRHRFASTKQ